MTELVKAFDKMGHMQGVVAGVYKEDRVELPEEVSFYPVFFDSNELPFKIVGMSDEMPYESTKYADLTQTQVKQFKSAFLHVIHRAIRDLSPDIILCHHLYLLTAFLREAYPNQIIFGICHNTDIRQLIKTDLERAFIKTQIQKLNHVFAASAIQKNLLKEHYKIKTEKITVIGTGYNDSIFYPRKRGEFPGKYSLTFAGKISKKKGVESLIRSLNYLPFGQGELVLNLIGSTGDNKEYQEIEQLAKEAPYKIYFIGAVKQDELASYYSNSDIFILPSFSEGIPLVVVEALACGVKVVVSELPGLKEWIDSHIKSAPVRYAKLPPLSHADEVRQEDLPAFEKRIAKAILESIKEGRCRIPDMSSLIWDNLSRRILLRWNHNFT